MEDKTPLKVSVDKSDLLTHFRPGDLLFGLEKEARITYRPFILAKFEVLETDHTYLTIDDINKALSADYIFNPNAHVKQIDLTSLHTMVSTHLVAWDRHPRYTISKITVQQEDARENKALINSCKVALFSHPNKIHFCLDNFDVEAIRDRKHKNYKSFTSRELRLCAKRWEEIKDRVAFYDDGKKCEAPWGKNLPIEWLISKKPTIGDNDSIDLSTPSDSSYKTPLYDDQNPVNFFRVESTPNSTSVASPELESNRGILLFRKINFDESTSSPGNSNNK